MKGTVSAALLSLMFAAGTAHAVDMGNMMNPSKWFGGDRNGEKDYRDGRSYGPPPGYRAPAPYGRAPTGHRGYGSTPGSTPMPRSPEECAARIRELEARVRELEARNLLLQSNQKPAENSAATSAPQAPVPRPQLNRFPPAPRN